MEVLCLILLSVWCGATTVKTPSYAFTTKNADINVLEGEDATIVCAIEDRPPSLPLIWINQTFILGQNEDIWEDNGRVKLVKTQEGNTEIFTLSLYNLGLMDEGLYECQVPGRFKLRQMNNIFVNIPPKITNDPNAPSNFDLKISENVILECPATGKPDPAVTWRRIDGRPIQGNDAVTGQQLFLNNVTELENGQYICIASNGFGQEQTRDFHVNVESKNTAYVYYAVRDRNEIRRVPASGGVEEAVNINLTHLDGPLAIAYDDVRGCLYWGNNGARRGIGRHCPSHTSSINLSSDYYADGIAVDPALNRLYTARNRAVNIIDFEKGSSRILSSGDMWDLDDIVLNRQTGWLFWADYGKRRIETARVNGTDRRQFLKVSYYPYGLTLSPDNNRLYVCGWHFIQSIGVDGSGLQTHFHDDQYIFNSIAVDDQLLYVRSHSPSYTIWRLDIHSVNATGQDLIKLTDTGTRTGGIVLVGTLLQETTTTAATDLTTAATDLTTTALVHTEPSSSDLPDIFKYVSLIAIPIMLVLIVTGTVCFCIKTGKCASCKRSRTESQQDADVYYEEVSAIPMSHRPLASGARRDRGAAAAQPSDEYLVPVPLASGTQRDRGAAAAQPCDDYLVPVPEPPHTYIELV